MVSDMISKGSVSCVYFMISLMFYPAVPKNLTSFIENELGFVTKFTFLLWLSTFIKREECSGCCGRRALVKSYSPGIISTSTN